MPKQWDDIYRHEGSSYPYYNIGHPHEDLGRVVELFRERKVHRVLDLGCGAGRNAIPLAREGFEVHAMDASQAGLEILADACSKAQTRVHTRTGDVYKPLLYDSGFFDAIVCVQVLQHGTIDQIQAAVREMRRVLKPSGVAFVTVCGRLSNGKVRECLVRTAHKIAPNTYVPTLGSEAGLVHFVFNRKLLLGLFRDFAVIELWKDKRDYYCLVGAMKPDPLEGRR